MVGSSPFSITTGTILRTLLIVAGAALLFYLRDIVLIVITAVVIASAMEPAVRLLMQRGIARVFAVASVYLSIAMFFFSIMFFFVPPVLDDAATFLSQLPATISTLELTTGANSLWPWQEVPPPVSAADLLRDISTTLGATSGGAFATIATFFGGLMSFLLIIVLAFYFSVQETGVDDFLRIVTPTSYQAYVLDLWKRSERKIGKWMQGQLVLALLVGVLVYLGLMMLGVPYALLLAVLAAVAEIIPVFGPILAAIPAVAVGFVDGGVTLSFMVVALYLVVQQFEAHLIYPVVVRKVVGVPPILVILALLVGYELAGFLGILISVPIAGALQELITDIDSRKIRALAREGLTPGGEAK